MKLAIHLSNSFIAYYARLLLEKQTSRADTLEASMGMSLIQVIGTGYGDQCRMTVSGIVSTSRFVSTTT